MVVKVQSFETFVEEGGGARVWVSGFCLGRLKPTAMRSRRCTSTCHVIPREELYGCVDDRRQSRGNK